MVPRETEDNAYAKSWSDQQRVLWHVMIFSGVVNNFIVVTNGQVFGCSTTVCMSTIFADSRMEVRRYRRIEINGFNVVLTRSFF